MLNIISNDAVIHCDSCDEFIGYDIVDTSTIYDTTTYHVSGIIICPNCQQEITVYIANLNNDLIEGN